MQYSTSTTECARGAQPGVKTKVYSVKRPESWTDTPDIADGWRPRDVVGHLITGEQTDWME